MSSYLRSVVTWGERQTHRECVRRVSNSSRTYISIYMAGTDLSGQHSALTVEHRRNPARYTQVFIATQGSDPPASPPK